MHTVRVDGTYKTVGNLVARDDSSNLNMRKGKNGEKHQFQKPVSVFKFIDQLFLQFLFLVCLVYLLICCHLFIYLSLDAKVQID